MTGLGGEIRVQSELGKGTTFRVLLPPTADEVAASVPVVVVAGAVRRGRVLVVDDEPMITKALARALEPEHDVTIALSAGDAYQRIVTGERYDVILCDLMMPQMTGMELHGEFLRAASDQATRMVFLTGGAFTPGARAFLDGIPNQRVEKPYDPQNIRAIINDRVK